MHTKMSAADLRIVQREAHIAARRLKRQFQLKSSDYEDLRQDLLTDLIARMPAFDPSRGSIGAFSGTVMAHRAAVIGRRIRRERELFGAAPLSLDELIPGDDELTRGDVLPEEEGIGAFYGQPTDRFAEIDRRLAVERALGVLPQNERRFCAQLVEATPHGIATENPKGTPLGGRSKLYRHLRQVRLTFIAVGVEPAWDVSAAR